MNGKQTEVMDRLVLLIQASRDNPVLASEFDKLRVEFMEGSAEMFDSVMNASRHNPKMVGALELSSTGTKVIVDNVTTPLTDSQCFTAAHRMEQGEGGGFAEPIGTAFFRADKDNRERLVQSFNHIFRRFAC